MSDTIFALSSGGPPAAIAVVRISGPAARAAVEQLAEYLPPPRHASLRTLRHVGEVLDRALLLFFPGSATATGEDLVEFHLHGGHAVVRAVEDALATITGLRRAEPGEFTRRALANGRIDLTEAEGLADLLAAETEAQRRAAVRVAQGGLRHRFENWASRTLQLSATVEAMLDHADEDDVDASIWTNIARDAAAIAGEIDTLIRQPGVERLRDGIRVVLAGPPNAGKSTLLNALADRDAAIISPLAGTTRDRIEAPVMRNGIAYLLIDTAGLHDAPADIVEQAGIDRTYGALVEADIVLWLDDEGSNPSTATATWLHLHPRMDETGRGTVPSGRMGLSALSGQGIPELWKQIDQIASSLLPTADAMPLNRRQRDLASVAASALVAVRAVNDPLLGAEELRRALRAFDAVVGRSDVEAMLDALFGRFCIGK